MIKCLSVLILLFLLYATGYCQSDTARHLYASLNVGYRTFPLTDVNNIYAAEGFTNDHYNSTTVYSLHLEYTPIKKSRFSIGAQYDLIPQVTRDNHFYIKDSSVLANNNNHYDSTAYRMHTLAKVHSMDIAVLYSIPLNKVTLYGGVAASYSHLRMWSTQYSSSWHWINNAMPTLLQNRSENSLLNSEGGFGFQAQVHVKYRIRKRFYAAATVTVNIESFPLRDADGNKISTSPGIIGTSVVGFNYARYLNVQLSGIQAGIGIGYLFF